MRRETGRWPCACAVALWLAACGAGGPTSTESPPPLPPPDPSGAIVVDHRCTQLERVPVEWIALARQNLRVAYGHTSHGSQLVTGARAFRGSEGSTYYFTSTEGFRAGLFLNDTLPDGDLGAEGDLGWRDRTVALLGRADNDRNVVLWSWCSGVSGTSEAGIRAYLDAMDALERSYPGVRFVYMTGHLDGSGATGNLHRRNEQIRDFCRSGKKTLFDFADIESYDPDGATSYMERLADDACNYDSDGDGRPDRNWARSWVAAHPGDELSRLAASCEPCAHSEPLNCVLKGRAFWWLLARVAGWPGA